MKIGLTYLGAAILVSGAPVVAQSDLDAWNAQRAQAFSNVCMRSAPSFDKFEDLAIKAGFSASPNGMFYEPEVLASLQDHDGFCSCYMTVGAPDQTTMVTAMFAQLMADFGDGFTGDPQGLANVAPFQRDGVEAVSILDPRTLDGQPWVAARVTVAGQCPKKQGVSE